MTHLRTQKSTLSSKQYSIWRANGACGWHIMFHCSIFRWEITWFSFGGSIFQSRCCTCILLYMGFLCVCLRCRAVHRDDPCNQRCMIMIRHRTSVVCVVLFLRLDNKSLAVNGCYVLCRCTRTIYVMVRSRNEQHCNEQYMLFAVNVFIWIWQESVVRKAMFVNAI